MITQKRIRELFNYRDGHLYRKVKVVNGDIGDRAGHNSKSGYWRIKVDGKSHPAHRLIWIYHFGEMDADHYIDHINHVRNDNRIENLRCVTHRINMRNKLKRINNTSGYAGVSFHPVQKQWIAKITTEGKELWLGTFETKRDAIIARKTAERLLGYHELYDINGILIQEEVPSPRRL